MDALPNMRRSYQRGQLRRSDVAGKPWHQLLGAWIAEAGRDGVREPNAMILATAGSLPSARTVLCKQLDSQGVVWYSGRHSRKGKQLAERPQAAVCFSWPELERQVTARGPVYELDRDAVEAYWRRRPRESQLGAWASPQSQPVKSRAALEARLAQLEVEMPAEVPLPEHWTGWRLDPEEVEFWQGRAGRLHDRLRLRRQDGIWICERLGP